MKGPGELPSEQSTLLEFFRRIWREEKGYVYIALKDPNLPKDDPRFWQRKYFEWPAEEIPVVQTVLSNRSSHDVYFAPSIFRERSSKKEAVLGSFCFWIEFDGAMPAELKGLPNPSMIVQTSTETHQHIYWCVDQLLPVEKLEAVNRSLTYELGADSSGWDANQVLRPPGTLNHKKQLQASLIHNSEQFISSVAFNEIQLKNLPPKLDLNGLLPDVSEVVSKYQFPRNVWDLFKNGVTSDRSAGLMNLGYSLAEMNLMNLEILAILLHADNRWGKFSKRNDQMQRLGEIVTRARQKYPYKPSSSLPELHIVSIGDRTLLTTDIKVDWLWHGVLHQQGYLLLTGHTGVGKSQLSLDFAAHLVLGKEYLGCAIEGRKKVLFVSMEMGILELKYVREHQIVSYTEEERVVLENNLRYHPQGYPIYFNRDEHKVMLEEVIQREKVDCVIFDSLGSMTEQELSKETDAKNLMDWNDHLRAELGIATIIIHHHRKAQTGNKRPNSISDIYGSHYFTARATTVMTMWDVRKSGLIEVSFQKMRLSAPLKPWAIQRQSDLTFVLSNNKIIQDDSPIDLTDEEDATTEIEF